MELRGNQHLLHYISVIKGGKVVKSLNVTKGRPSLSFKELSTILNHGSNTQTIPLADRSSNNVFDPDMVKSEEEVFNNNCTGGTSNKRSQDSDDIFTGEMTLRQMKKKCKANIRKITRSGAEEVEQDNARKHPDEDNIDLAETLGSLKRKVSGKWKSRKIRKFKSMLKITDIVVKCEPVTCNEASIQVGSGFDMCASATIKIEDSDDSMPNEHHTTAKSVCMEIPARDEMMDDDYDQRIMEAVGSELPNADFCSPREESLFVAEECNVDQTCYKFQKNSGDRSPSHAEALKVGNSEMASTCKVTSKMQLTGEICTSQKDSLIFVQGANVTNADSVSDEHHKPEVFACEDVLVVNDQNIIEMVSNKHHTTVRSPEIPAREKVAIRSSDANCCSPRKDSSIIAKEPKDCTLNQNCYELESSSHEEAVKVTQEDKAVTDALICNESPDILFTSDCNKDDVIPSSLGKSPERLLSGRKTISPDSQQKLCMAMKSLDLPNLKETEKCKQRLCFEKQEVNGNTVSPNSEHKNKRDKKCVRSKVAPPAWYRISSACGCIQSCSQNIIDFSQQQMIDTERLAVNLTKELRSMKDLMIDMLQPQGKRVSTSRNNINEVRVAVENATKVEEMARRFIAGMTRDCNRFCKILSLAEKNTVAGNNSNSAESIADREEASENDATKGKKKITFADESGRSLCNVRLIQDNESLPVETGELNSS